MRLFYTRSDFMIATVQLATAVVINRPYGATITGLPDNEHVYFCRSASFHCTPGHRTSSSSSSDSPLQTTWSEAANEVLASARRRCSVLQSSRPSSLYIRELNYCLSSLDSTLCEEENRAPTNTTTVADETSRKSQATGRRRGKFSLFIDKLKTSG